MPDTRLRVVLYEESGIWIAQCLERDISAQGKNAEEAGRRLEVTIRLEMAHSVERGEHYFQSIEPAPREIQDMWDTVRLRGHIEIPAAGPPIKLNMAHAA
jgi:hypothetical protein